MSNLAFAYSYLQEQIVGRGIPREAVADAKTLVEAISGVLNLDRGNGTGLTHQQLGALSAILDKIPPADQTPAMANIRSLFEDPHRGLNNVIDFEDQGFRDGLRKAGKFPMTGLTPRTDSAPGRPAPAVKAGMKLVR